MKIEINSLRVLLESQSPEEESMLAEFIETSDFNRQLRLFLGIQPLPSPTRLRAMTKEEMEAYKKRLGRFMTVIEMHGYDEQLFETIRQAMEAVGKTFADRNMIKSCRTEVVGS